MHETALIKDLVREIEVLAHQHGSCRVAGAHVRLGALAPLTAAGLRDQFRHASEGTPAENAQLIIVEGTDIHDPSALGVLLESIDLSLTSPHPIEERPEPEELLPARLRAAYQDGVI